MQLEWLEDFIELARVRSLSRAAENRCVTHPAFGRRIRALEDWAGVALLERKQPLSLTPAGLLFLDAATQALEGLNTVRAQFKASGPTQDTPLRIATGRTLASDFFPDWYEALTGRFGVFPVSIVTSGAQEAIRRLAAREVDLLLIFSSPQTHLLIDPDRFQSMTLTTEALLPVSAPLPDGSPKFAIAADGHGPVVPWLALSPTLTLRGALARHLAGLPHRLSLRMIYEADSYEAILEMARRGNGLAWLPRMVVQKSLDSAELVIAAGAQYQFSFDISLHRLRANHGELLMSIWKGLQADAPKMSAD